VEDVTDLERRRRITRWIYKSTASPWKQAPVWDVSQDAKKNAQLPDPGK